MKLLAGESSNNWLGVMPCSTDSSRERVRFQTSSNVEKNHALYCSMKSRGVRSRKRR
jgi:hypothetical protein